MESVKLIEENKKILEAARRRCGINYEKVQESALDILEIAKKQNLNSVEFQKVLKLLQESLNYSLSGLSASTWVSRAAQKAKE